MKVGAAAGAGQGSSRGLGVGAGWYSPNHSPPLVWEAGAPRRGQPRWDACASKMRVGIRMFPHYRPEPPHPRLPADARKFKYGPLLPMWLKGPGREPPGRPGEFPVTEALNPILSWIRFHFSLLAPLVLAAWMAWGDVRRRRIPNYLTLGAALAGLGFHFGTQGWAGLGQGLLGLGLGFSLMIGFYLKGGMGAGDVKALAALGTWLGPLQTLYLFVYMGLAGIPLLLICLWRRGELKARARQLWLLVVSRCLLRTPLPRAAAPAAKSPGLPYAVALALGMAFLCWRGGH